MLPIREGFRSAALRNLAFMGVVGAVVCGMIEGLLFGSMLPDCSPAAQRQVEYAAEEATHSAELADCLRKAKADSGTLAEFCVCYARVNARYKVDAGPCE